MRSNGWLSLWLLTPLSLIFGVISMVVRQALVSGGMGTGYYQLGVAVIFYAAGLIVSGKETRWKYICVAILYLFALSHTLGLILSLILGALVRN